MPPVRALQASYFRILLLVLIGIVHETSVSFVLAQTPKRQAPAEPGRGAAPSADRVEVRRGTVGLPAPVLEMREAIVSAAATGRIEEMLIPIEMNEIKPVFGDGPAPDPIAYLKQASADGQGLEVLAALTRMFEGDYAVVPLGRDIENNRLYVWPALAATGVKDLTVEQTTELRRLVPEPLVQKMLEGDGSYTYWRLGIGADGVWHVLTR